MDAKPRYVCQLDVSFLDLVTEYGLIFVFERRQRRARCWFLELLALMTECGGLTPS